MLICDRLSCDYVSGYTQAIVDIINIFEYVNNEMNMRKMRMNYKLVMKLLKTIFNERGNIRDRIGDGFIRWNLQRKDFEYYQRSGKK